MRRTFPRRAVFQLGLPLYLAACASEEEPPSGAGVEPGKTQVTLFSWWVAPSEADALNALIAVHSAAYPDEKVSNAAIESGERAREVLSEQLASGTPPDLFQENAYDMAAFLAENPGALEPLGDLFDELKLFDVVVPEVIEDVTIDGQVYSMPVNIHRENALHYNQRIFQEQGLEPPTTLEELLGVCQALKAQGITPLATSHKGWIVRILFNSLAAASLGSQAYREYFTGEAGLDEPAMRAAIELLGEVLDSYVNESASDPDFDWTDAAELVLNGEAAMFIHGDWVKGFLTEQGLAPGSGFGVVGMPGASDLFLYGVDVFALPAGAPHAAAAKNFLRSVASKAGQVAFNKLKGSSPIRLDTEVEDLDAVVQATLADLQNAEVRMLTRSKPAWDEALAAFAVDRDVDALLAAYVDNPP